MALQINKLEIEAVIFGDFKAVPRMSQEKKLRVSKLSLKAGNEEKIMDVLSSCFGDDEAKVREFMEKNMSMTDFARLQTYLLGGDDAVAALDSRIEKTIDKQIDRALDAAAREKATEGTEDE